MHKIIDIVTRGIAFLFLLCISKYIDDVEGEKWIAIAIALIALLLIFLPIFI